MNNNPFFNPIATTNNNQQEEAVLKDIALFDVVGCLEQRWKDHNYHIYDCGRERLISEDDDEKRIEKYVEEQYSNDCGLAKQWIKNDLKKQKKQQKVRDTTCRHGELDLSLLSTLDENVKFDILEFIPTYSKWKAFIQEGKQAKYLDVIKFPRINDNDSNQGTFQKEVMSAHEYRLDLPFITFHKMRLICKRFNTRMMRRILQTTELIVCNFSFTIITYFATFLRMQRLFKENNDKLPTDSIYLYSDQMLLSINFQNTPSQPTITLALSQPSPPLYTSAFSDGFSPFPYPLLPINTGLNYPAHANCINENDTDEEEAEEGDSDNETTSFWNGNVPPPNAININNILYGNSLYSLPNFNNDRTNNLPHDSDTNELTPKFELKPRTPMYFPFDNHAFVPFQENRVGQLYYALEPLVCSSFIGENTTLQSLIIMAAQPGMSVTTNLFPYLKALKNLMIWGSGPRCDISSSYVQQVVMINMDCDNACELFPNAKIITQYVTSGGLSDTSNHSIIQKKDASELIDVLQSMESRIVMKLMDENGYPQQIVLTMGASELFLSSVIRLAAEKSIQRTKSFVTYLIKDLRSGVPNSQK
ncbi:hypothetical protein C9374_004366 [Naegleria lovaniensis]|uniref:Uncharacterized protein n=1 Tax=Naegleria lovaniensis TaxID=51637 RepID=A0AA88GNJ2_NAELO|nr:uncharacterized protein C9374_004366 [Naegleria lovaniensis]KAG2383695.1 hypothetical protein C9374_004366 [Naegleria lovaniensis]